MSAIVFGMVLPWLLLAVGCWLGYQFLRQNGRILLRLEMLEKELGQLRAGSVPETPSPSPGGLARGAAAPNFELPDLAGGRRSLTQFRGQKVLLIFFNPQCGFCTKMMSSLADLASAEDENSPVLLVVTTGDAETNRKLFAEHGVRCAVLLQKEMEVASKYLTGGTPTGYLIGEDGTIASELAMGADALLALAAASGGLRDGQPTNGAPAGKVLKKHKPHQPQRLANGHRRARVPLAAPGRRRVVPCRLPGFAAAAGLFGSSLRPV